jgi:hypothetical protein
VCRLLLTVNLTLALVLASTAAAAPGLRQTYRPRGRLTPLAGESGWKPLGRIATPTGMTQASFGKLMSRVRTAPEFAEAEAVVLFGSRTHAHYGYKAKTGSDLDVRIFWKDHKNIDRTVSRTYAANGALASLGREVGFDIAQEIIKFYSLDQNLRGPGALDFTTHRMASERRMWKQVENRKDLPAGDDGRDARKFAMQKRVTRRAEWTAIGKEAIVVLLGNGPTVRKRVEELVKRDYRNIIIMHRPKAHGASVLGAEIGSPRPSSRRQARASGWSVP